MVFNLFHSFTVTVVLALSAAAAPFNNTIYIISNAETPSLGLPGLTPIGLQRVQDCLPALLAPLDIGLVVTCPFDPDSGKCAETIATATPIADSLGLTVDTSCGADEETDDDCVPKLLKNFGKNSTQSMLVIWKKVTSAVSQGCPGIDGQAPGTFRRSLRRAVKKRRLASRIMGRQA
ncbi:hypothetical protein BDZ97DRAFT_1758610 [Flammula alnicola]|nr:hypothetical protein BDZ97DRAFT_1758610 [Flammula alnicola]